MNKLNPNNRDRYLIIYSEDYKDYIWEEICEALLVNPEETRIRINCDIDDIITGSEMEEK